MTKFNPFSPIYAACNSGSPQQKYNNLRDFPIYFDIELTNNCNFKCLFCLTGTKAAKRGKGFMSDDVFYKFANEIIAKNQELSQNIGVRFIRWGEPTLHPKFLQYSQMLKSHEILCHLNTNGSILTDEQYQKLIDMRFDSIKFSFQGIDAKSYQEMRNNDFFEQLLQRIRRLYEMRGEKELPYIHIATTVTYETDEQIAAFKEIVGAYSDLVTVGRTKLEHIDVENSLMTKEEKNRFKELLTKQTLLKKRFNCCPEVFDKLSLNWDGSVSACCMDYDKLMMVGDLNTSTLQEIWNSDILAQYRLILSNCEYDKIKVCSDCYDYMNIQG